MRPLPVTHTLVYDEEQFDRSAKHLVVTRESSEPPGAVGPRNSEKGVHVLTQLEATCPIRLPKIRRVNKTLGALVRALLRVGLSVELHHHPPRRPRHSDYFSRRVLDNPSSPGPARQ